MNKSDIDKLEVLRGKWETIAQNVDDLYGPNQPAATALRLCVADLGYLVRDAEDSKKPPFKI